MTNNFVFRFLPLYIELSSALSGCFENFVEFLTLITMHVVFLFVCFPNSTLFVVLEIYLYSYQSGLWSLTKLMLTREHLDVILLLLYGGFADSVRMVKFFCRVCES